MRIFITGGSGWIGSAVIPELLAAGHTVTGLARSDESAARLVAAGVTPLAGSLGDLGTLSAGAAASDGVIHLGFNHDFSDYLGAGRTERAAVEAIGDALAGTDRPFLFASGLAGLAEGRVATELDANPFTSPESPRGAGENLALSYADRGVRSVALRFAPTVHGERDHGFVAQLVTVARERGASAYVDDGTNRWPAVHRLDVARMVALALDAAPAGSRLHGAAEEGVAAREIAEAIGRQLGLPVVSVPAADAPEHFGWIGRFFGADIPASSARTQHLLGWTPLHQGLIADLDAGYYN